MKGKSKLKSIVDSVDSYDALLFLIIIIMVHFSTCHKRLKFNKLASLISSYKLSTDGLLVIQSSFVVLFSSAVIMTWCVKCSISPHWSMSFHRCVTTIRTATVRPTGRLLSVIRLALEAVWTADL